MLVDVRQLTKTFRKVTAVDGVSFGIERGEILGLLGPNGAGKSTIIQMLMGLLRPTRGDVSIFGLPLQARRRAIARRMNVMSPYLSLPGRLTVAENLDVYARLYGVPGRSSKIAALLRSFAIEHLRDTLTVRLSSGEATRVAFAKALLNDPELLLLDEPTAYLDPQAAAQMRETILHAQRERGATILYTSHNMQEVEQICSRIVFLHRGRILAAGSPLEVSRAILRTEVARPALQEVYLHVASGSHR
ncbi:MAG: ABC transporter ATP-binding protein [Acidobacteriaceae bacterium]